MGGQAEWKNEGRVIFGYHFLGKMLKDLIERLTQVGGIFPHKRIGSSFFPDS